jgi:hypothetical protein
LTACDEGGMLLRNPDGKTHSRLWIVLGNGPGEIVCDYTVHPRIEEITDAHYEEWQSKPQPTAFCKFAAERHEFNKRADEAREAYNLKLRLQLGVAVENFND